MAMSAARRNESRAIYPYGKACFGNCYRLTDSVMLIATLTVASDQLLVNGA